MSRKTPTSTQQSEIRFRTVRYSLSRVGNGRLVATRSRDLSFYVLKSCVDKKIDLADRVGFSAWRVKPVPKARRTNKLGGAKASLCMYQGSTSRREKPP